MIDILRANERGRTHIDWLDSAHSFSFGHYYNPEQMGFGVLRVINDDRIVAGSGFGRHPHQNMEIITYVVEGGLQHDDSLGHGSVIQAGDVQRMTAGRGIQHSEFNASKVEPARFLQIWIIPAQHNLEPSYQDKSFPLDGRENQLRLLVAPTTQSADALSINQDVKIYGGYFNPGETVEYSYESGRRGWLQIVRGSLELGSDNTLVEGDGAAISNEHKIIMKAVENVEFLLFDLP